MKADGHERDRVGMPGARVRFINGVGGQRQFVSEEAVGALIAGFAAFFALGQSWVGGMVVAVLTFVTTSTMLVAVRAISIARARPAENQSGDDVKA